MGAVMKMDGTPLDQRKLPHNIDAEQMLLGALLNENDWFAKVGQDLKAEDFYEPIHGMIYETFASLIEGGQVATPVSMKPYVEDFDFGGVKGGFDYLMNLWKVAPKRIADAIDYAKIVKDHAITRTIHNILEEEIEDIKAGRPFPATKRLDRVETLINDLRPPLTSQSGFERFDRAAQRAVDIAARAYQRGGVIAGLSTGLERLDGVLGGLHRGDLIVIAGATSMGKTALGLNIAYAVAQGLLERQQNGEKTGVVAINSLEMPGDQIAQRILAEHTRIPGWRLRQGKVSETEFTTFSDAAKSLAALPIEIDATGQIPINQVISRARSLKKRRGIELLVVDYIQLMKGIDRKRDTARYQEVAEITGGLKSLAKELDIPIIALSQIARDIDKRPDTRPKLSDLRESASIEMDSDVVMFVHRLAYYLSRSEPKAGNLEHAEWSDAMERAHGWADIIIGKNRHGPIETVSVGFDGMLTRFKDDLPEPVQAAPKPEKGEAPKKLSLSKEALISRKVLQNLAITASFENDGHVDAVRKGHRLIRYEDWKLRCVGEILGPEANEKNAYDLMRKVCVDLQMPSGGHPSQIGRGGPSYSYVWLTESGAK